MAKPPSTTALLLAVSLFVGVIALDKAADRELCVSRMRWLTEDDARDAAVARALLRRTVGVYSERPPRQFLAELQAQSLTRPGVEDGPAGYTIENIERAEAHGWLVTLLISAESRAAGEVGRRLIVSTIVPVDKCGAAWHAQFTEVQR